MTELQAMEIDNASREIHPGIMSQLTTSDWRDALPPRAELSNNCGLQSLELTQQGDRQISDNRINSMVRDLALYMHPGEDDSTIYWGGLLGLYQSGCLSWLKDIKTQADLDFLKKSYRQEAGADLGADLDHWLTHGWSHQKEAWHAHLDKYGLSI